MQRSYFEAFREMKDDSITSLVYDIMENQSHNQLTIFVGKIFPAKQNSVA